MAQGHLLIDEFTLDISKAYGMLGYGAKLTNEINDWCYSVLGSVPEMSIEIQSTTAAVYLIFENSDDPILFKINFADRWTPRNAG